MLIYRLGGQFDAETFEGLDINLRQHDGGVNLAAAQFFELFQGDLCVFVGSGAHGQRDQNFIGVETRVAASEVLDFQLLDRLDRDRRDQVLIVRNIAKYLDSIQKQGSGSAEQVGCLSGGDGSVRKFDGSSRSTGFFGAFQGSRNNLAHIGGQFCLLHQKFDLINFLFADILFDNAV